MILSRELLGRVIEIIPIASKDETRFHLGHVKLSPLDNGVLLEVTDGFKAIRDTLIDTTIGLEKTMYVHRSHLPLLKHCFKTGDYSPLKQCFSYDNIGYPNTESIEAKQGDYEVSFNPKYLLDLHKALAVTGKEAVILSLKTKGELQCKTAIQVIVGKKKGTLMPVKIGWKIK